MYLTITFIAGWFTDRDGFWPRQLVQKMEQIRGILARHIDADIKVGIGVLSGQAVQHPFESLVTTARLEEFQWFGRRLSIFTQKGSVMPIAGCVEADANGSRCLVFCRNQFLISFLLNVVRS
jgi:hypothetical protein